MADYKLFNSSGSVVATIGTTLPTASLRVCSKNDYKIPYSGAYAVRPFYCYEFNVGGTYYYANIAGISGLASGLVLSSRLGRYIIAPYAFNANGSSASDYSVAKGQTLWLYSSTTTLMNQSIDITNNTTVYDASGNAYTVKYAYDFTITAATGQYGNIAIYDGDTNTLVAGSASAIKAAASSYTYTFTTSSSTKNVKIVATAATSSYENWHNKYFFNGLSRDGSEISDSKITFTANVATYSVSISDNTSFFVAYGVKYAVTVAKGNGIASSSLSYSRTHSTGSYVATTISPTSLSGAGTLYVESGRSLTAKATASSGYVFSTSDGFISQTSGVSSLYGANSSSISGTIPTITKAATFNITASSYSISIKIADSSQSGWGSVYIDSSGTTSKTLVQGVTYRFYFSSSRDAYEAPTVSAWYVNGSKISGDSYTASSLTGSVAVTCTLTQNAYPVTVSAGSDGTAKISGRYVKSSGAMLSNTGYLCADGRDYMKLSVTPDAHYSEFSSGRVVSNLVEYSSGGEYCYSLASAASGSVTFYFQLSECVIKTATTDSSICSVSPSSQALSFSSGSLVNVYCTIKTAYVGLYRVDYFTLSESGAKYTAEAGGDGQYYYSVGASIISGRSTATFVPHLVSTTNTLTVAKTGETTFATVYISIDGTEESLSGNTQTWSVRENRPVVCRSTVGFGGKIASITSSGVSDPVSTESQISFSMPTANASVTFTVAEKDKVTLALNVANKTSPDVAVGKVTLTCSQSDAVHEEVSSLELQSFQVYKDTIYRLEADDTNEEYAFVGWYLNDEFLSSELYIDISRSALSSKYTAQYALRGTGTIAISYGIKSGDQIQEAELPPDSQPFGLVIDTTPNKADPDEWIIGVNRYIQFHATDNGTSVEDGLTYIWTPVRVDVMLADEADTWTTVWTYDKNNSEARSGKFVMRGNMLVRLAFTKVLAEGYGRVQALFVDGDTKEMGELAIYATSMLTYYSIGGIAEANCYISRKVVLTASPKPGWAFGGWYKLVDGEYKAVQDNDTGVTTNGTILTCDAVPASGLAYYAAFTKSDNNVKAWGSGENAKEFEWRSKVYVGSQFFALRNVRIYSDVYPVSLFLMTATSPNGCFADGAKSLELIIHDQSPRQIPVMQLEKYFAFRLNGRGRINHIAIASSMEALK